MKSILMRPAGACTPRGQRGVVLLFALIALAIMMIASVALVRSFNSSMYTSGNVAFKRDMQNQAQRAVTAALATVQGTGALITPLARSTAKAQYNYSATSLETTAEGIPKVLLIDAETFDQTWTAGAIVPADQGITIRYVVDRLCNSEGLDTDLGAARCQIVGPPQKGGSGSHLINPEDTSSSGGGSLQLQIVYRISVRVDGPRNSQSFYQSTFTM
ncbi:hypothetical protein [Rhizobacter sp. Root1221]|uniref:pilus assembly PilX family protein n=1 Tax=Rhizobacter sp. Root1221 TaxID=1736433 RepID=UPI0006F8D1CA|nr:hypothetical protein [Rhizobacter sp. Root1221]KQW02592.1 hypothetical protein ASC87_12825 [Rhizobacter sp. Root1221]